MKKILLYLKLVLEIYRAVKRAAALGIEDVRYARNREKFELDNGTLAAIDKVRGKTLE